MYFLSACLIVIVASAALSLRHSANVSAKLFKWSTAQQRLAARRRALWPMICGLFCLSVLLGIFQFQIGKPEAVGSITAELMMLVASFVGGWFLGLIGGWIE